MSETAAHLRYRIAHKDRVKATYDKWYAGNRESWLARRRAKTPKKTRIVQSEDARKQKAKHRTREWKYGVSETEYRRLLAEQHGLCAVCRQPEHRTSRYGKVRELCVDHNHRTNQVRALLCTDCNWALGHVKEDILILRALITYLESHNG